MSTTESRLPFGSGISTDDVTATVLGVCAEIDERSDELAQSARVPDDLYERIALGGLFRQLVHPDIGGVGGAAIDWFTHGVELARHDASVAWVVTQGAAELGWIGSGGDAEWCAQVLADDRAASASTIAGVGTLDVAADGCTGRLQGRWGFDTGCHGATWIGGLAEVRPSPDGQELEYRFCWVPADRAEILDDWNPTGLRGTGSNSIVIPEQEIPLAWTIETAHPSPHDRGPYRALVGNGNWPIACSVAAVQLGASRRALDEARRVLARKLDLMQRPLLKNPGLHFELMEIEARWHAAHAFMERELTSMWDQAERHGTLDGQQRVRLKLAAGNANRTAVEAVGAATRITGTCTVDPHHPLTRSCRDVMALQGHIGTCRSSIELAARFDLGLDDMPSRHV